jgi:hypothetical protein
VIWVLEPEGFVLPRDYSHEKSRGIEFLQGSHEPALEKYEACKQPPPPPPPIHFFHFSN